MKTIQEQQIDLATELWAIAQAPTTEIGIEGVIQLMMPVISAYTAAVEAIRDKAPEGWKLVPIEPTDAMCEVYRTWQREGLQYMDIGIIKAIIEAAPKEPS